MELVKQDQKDLQQAYFRLIVSNAGRWLEGSELEMFRYLCDRTLRFGKYSQWLRSYDFENGLPSTGLPGFPHWTRGHRAKIRDQVKGRGFVFYDINYSEPERGVIYTINVPGIWRLLNRVYYQEESKHVTVYLDILKRSLEHFRLAGYDEEYFQIELNPKLEKGIMMIEEAVKRGMEVSRVGREKRKLRDKKRDLKPGMVRRLMVEYCAEFEIPYYDIGFTGRELRSAKNWLKYCREVGHDPREVLYEVCKFWRSFSKGAMIDDKGKQIVLPDTVSFWKYYQYRREIGSWIEANREHAGESDDKWDRIADEYERKQKKKKGSKG
jgi:hypothetical protein